MISLYIQTALNGNGSIKYRAIFVLVFYLSYTSALRFEFRDTFHIFRLKKQQFFLIRKPDAILRYEESADNHWVQCVRGGEKGTQRSQKRCEYGILIAVFNLK